MFTSGSCKNGYLSPGSGVSVDHFESILKGRTYTSLGKISSDEYIGDCNFVDLESGYSHVEHQLGIQVQKQFVSSKIWKKIAFDHYAIVEDYLANNGVCKAKSFISHLRDQNQLVKFCGVTAHHQNGVAECLLLHPSVHWENGIDT